MGFSIDSAPLQELDKQMDDIWADIDRLQRKQKEMQTTGIETAKQAAGITEETNTFTKWKELGYKVQHGASALFGCSLIWGSRGDGATYKASFFGKSQVEVI